MMVTGREIELGERETIADTARVLSRYVDAIMIRMLDHDAVVEMAQHATVPVINGLTKRQHPCQVMADVMTFEERKGPIKGKRIAWTGDTNNVLTSWIHAAGRLDFELAIATPEELAPPPALLAWAKDQGAKLSLTRGRKRPSRVRLRHHRLLGLDGRRGRHPSQSAAALPGR